MIQSFDQFEEIWFADFEYQQQGSDLPKPVCLVAYELRSKREIKLWRDDLEKMDRAPYSLDGRSLFVTYFASAELWCHLALNWKLPQYLLDLHVEFLHLTNGVRPKGEKANLLSALRHFGIESIESEQKNTMRDLILRNQNWSASEKEKIILYCESDVIALEALFEVMKRKIEPRYALLRGRYLTTVGQSKVPEFLSMPVHCR